jgi:hypothetical protein
MSTVEAPSSEIIIHSMPEEAAPQAPTRLTIGPRATWFQVDDLPPVSIAKHAAMRRLLLALAALRQHDKAATLSVGQAFAAGWPGERAAHRAAANRVYTALHALRSFGLRPILVRTYSGYRLTLDARLVTSEDGADRRPAA